MLDLFVRDDAAFDRVDQKHFSRLQTAFHLYLLRCDFQHAGFGGHDHNLIMRYHISSGTQTIAIERGSDDAAVCERNRRRAVPGLHQASVILIKRPLIRLHVRISCPSFWNQHGHRVRQAAPGLEQKL